jgi:hypothetical protein
MDNLTSVIRELHSTDPSVRIKAARFLEGLAAHPPFATEALIAALADDDPNVHRSCRQALEKADARWVANVSLQQLTSVIGKAKPAARVNLAEAIRQCGASAGPWMPTLVLPWFIKETDWSVLRALRGTFDSVIAKLTEDPGCLRFIDPLIQKARSCDHAVYLAEVASVLDVFATYARDAIDALVEGFLLPTRDAQTYIEIGKSLDSIYYGWNSLRRAKEVASVLQTKIENAKIPQLDGICLDWPSRDVGFLQELKQHTSHLLAMQVVNPEWTKGPQLSQWLERLLPRLVLQTGRDWVDNWLRHEIMDELAAADLAWPVSEPAQRFLQRLIGMLTTRDARTARGVLCAIASYYRHGPVAIPPLREFVANSQFNDGGALRDLASHVLRLIGDLSARPRGSVARLLETVT